MCRARATRCRSARGAGCARGRTACSARSRSCRGGRGSTGLRPAPAVVPAAGRQQQQQRQKLAFRGMAGWVRLVGTGVRSRCDATGSDPIRISALVGANLGWHALAVREMHPRMARLY
ncbi:hypothetical protein EGJ89_09710 [Stenotrophomonas maltophilia]|nr:hypothetical protein EGJ89_09710 [Stenotrophomonas maltophilia]